jgi:hypothetical protein
MKIFSTRTPAPTLDYSDRETFNPSSPKYWITVLTKWEKNEAKMLQENGWDGKYTGKVISFGVADGKARYMIAHRKRRQGAGEQLVLCHLASGDAWEYPDVALYSAKKVKELADRQERIDKLFGGG